MAYEPKYSKGEIAIYFIENSGISGDFAKTYIEINYPELDIDFYEVRGEEYVFNVPHDKEREYCDKISKNKFIDHADRIDSRLRERFELYEKISSASRSLDEQLEEEKIDLSKLRKLLIDFENS